MDGVFVVIEVGEGSYWLKSFDSRQEAEAALKIGFRMYGSFIKGEYPIMTAQEIEEAGLAFYD